MGKRLVCLVVFVLGAAAGKTLADLVACYPMNEGTVRTDTRAKGAAAIVCSPIPRNNWSEGKVRWATNDYTHWAQEAATAENTPFIDLNDLIACQYRRQSRAAGYYVAKSRLPFPLCTITA